MRCPDCSKFVAYDTEAEPNADLEINAEGVMTGEVERTLPCAECGTDLKGTTFSIDQDLNEVIDVQPYTGTETLCTKAHDWDWEEAGDPVASATERLNDKDRHGKQIKHTRFMTKYYGVEITGDVRCKDCPAVGVYSFQQEEAASGFDELV